MKTATQQVIGLWLDTTSDAPHDGGTWIVSRDEIYADGTGENASNATVATFATDQYDAARAKAIELAIELGLCVIETNEDQTQECIYRPEGQPNPLSR